MKIVQIIGGSVHWDASGTVSSLEMAAKLYAPNIVFVEAPDYVFEGWGYDALASGDARFIKPEAPDGWLYDDATGTFYKENSTKPSEIKGAAELTRENEELKNTITELELAMVEMYEMSLGGME